MEHKIFMSQRGKEIIIKDNYIYNYDRSKDGQKIFRCSNRTYPGKLTLSEENNLFLCTNHNHSQEKKKCDRLIFLSQVKNRANESNERPIDIITNITKNIPDCEIPNLQRFKSISNQIRNIRNKEFAPLNTLIYDIPQVLKLNLREEEFLIFDTEPIDRDRIIILQSPKMNEFMQKSEIFIIDGTFKSVPSEFTQLITIQAYIFGRSFPCFFILCKSKSESTYIKIFNELKKLKFQPKYMISDFEKAFPNAGKVVFTNIVTFGCIFHFGQACWRRLQDLGLVSYYKSNNIFRKFFRKMLNLTFYPEDKIIYEFEKLAENILIHSANSTNINNIDRFVSYFKRMFIGDISKKNEPIYDIKFWSSYNRVLNEIPRTTNSCEGWHRNFNYQCGTSSPNIARFISVLQKVEEVVRFKYIQITEACDLSVTNINFSYEYILKTTIKNFKIFELEKYGDALEKVTKWKLDDE